MGYRRTETMPTVTTGDPRDPAARALLDQNHALMQELFPPEDNYALDIDALCAPDIVFFVAQEDGVTLGTGALALRAGYGEVKSMFTATGARGKGVAAALLTRIETEARDRALPLLRLETAEALEAAVRLYIRHGFMRRGIFGDYLPNRTSLYMEKPLA